MLRLSKCIAFSTALGLSSVSAQASENVMVVFDGSNSMWGQIEGVAKIEIAWGVMETLLGEWTEDRNVGLMAYGHRERADCGDIETLVAEIEDELDLEWISQERLETMQLKTHVVSNVTWMGDRRDLSSSNTAMLDTMAFK